MDDREITLSLAADLRALLPVVRHHITMLSTPATARQDPTAGPELARLTGAMADDCAQAEVEDCALLLYALHDHFATTPGALPPRFAALVWDALTFVQDRVEAMGAQVSPRSPTAVLRARAEQMAHALAEPPSSRIGGLSSAPNGSGRFPSPAHQDVGTAPHNDDVVGSTQPLKTDVAGAGDVDVSLADETLTDDELTMLQVFQASPLRHSAHDPLTESEAEVGHAVAGHTDDNGDTAPLPRQKIGAGAPIAAAAPGAYSGAPVPRQAPTAEDLDHIPPEMKQLFLVETTDDAQDLRLALLRYQQHPDDTAALAVMGRVAHKIKGAAATLGFETLARVLLSFEDVIKAVQSRRMGIEARAGDVLVREMALVQEALDNAAREVAPNEALIAEARRLYEMLLRGEAVTEGRAELAKVPAPVEQESPGALDAPEADSAVVSESESYLRVDIRRLDELMRHISSLAVNRAALTQAREEAVRLQAEMDQALTQLSGLSGQFLDLQPFLRGSAVREIASNGDSHHDNSRAGLFRVFGGRDRQVPSTVGDNAVGENSRGVAWDALELDQFTEFDHALRKLNEVVADLDTTSRQLRSLLVRLSQLSEEQTALAGRMQRDVMHVRLVPLKDMVPRLELETLRLGPLLEKSVAFSVRGEMTEIDRNISESLAGPLLQLVRNAIVHGIESPEERREQGKPEIGQIWLHAYYVGSEVIIEVGDDGRGINALRLAAAAMAHGELDADTARNLSSADALELIFRPGVTTLKAAQVVGGRGIGLDDVRTTIASLKGSITVRSEPGQGTVFRVRVPISLSIVRVLRVDSADQHYAVPFSSVQRTASLSASELLVSAAPMQNGGDSNVTLPVRRIRTERPETAPVVGELPESERYEEIPVFALAELLGVEHTMHDPQLALVVEVGRRRVAMLVDDIHEDSEVVVQALPPHLRRKALRGGSVTPSGQLLLLLDLPELIGSLLDGPQPGATLRPRPMRPALLAPRVLVVDDSVSIRRSLEHTLRRAGFEVQVARDGIEALELMIASAPRVLVLDIEMPRLDGFELLSIVRESPQFAGIRVAMLTSRAGDKHKEHARQLGAEAYLVKPCPQETLVTAVRELLTESAVIS